MSNHSNVPRLAKWLQESDYTAVLTGAGMSTESGIPDFRSKTGWWRSIDPRTVATVEALNDNYSLFHEFYSMRIKALHTIQPHQGHYILADWQRRGIIACVATQNVDGLHQLAGNTGVLELHGSIHAIRCHTCQTPSIVENFLEKRPCANCGGRLRPGVVLFGEALPERVWSEAIDNMVKADLVLVIGSSLQVYPVNQLPAMAGGKIALINHEETGMDPIFDLVLHGKAGEVLEALMNCIDIL